VLGEKHFLRPRRDSHSIPPAGELLYRRVSLCSAYVEKAGRDNRAAASVDGGKSFKVMPKTYTNRQYLDFIRSKPCIRCDRPAVAAHQNLGQGCMAGKASDIQALPLCNDCHNMAGRSEHRGQVTFWADVLHINRDDFATWHLFKEHVEGCKALLILRYIAEYLRNGGKL